VESDDFVDGVIYISELLLLAASSLIMGQSMSPKCGFLAHH
jgi:hypothetical protein